MKTFFALVLIGVVAAYGPAKAEAGDHPDANGCYTNYWFDPFVLGVNCTHPALGDPEEAQATFRSDPPAIPAAGPPPHECPYDKQSPSRQ